MAVMEKSAGAVSLFLYALKAPETRRQWPNRLKIVFTFFGFTGDLNEQARMILG
jgi:hypothetical protein